MVKFVLFTLFSFSLVLLVKVLYCGGFVVDLNLFYNSFMFNEHYFLVFDWMSLLFFSVLIIISFSVFTFSKVYMAEDLKNNRFLYILLMFVVSMVVLMFSPSLFWVLMGWDGLGITSVVLMLFFFAKSSFSAGVKTYLMNRLGDGLFMVSLLLLLDQGWLNILEFKAMSFFSSMILVLCLCTKSAQFPFSSWLPVAMAAPTPVSALVHSSTLVTAGVYLFMRLKSSLKFLSLKYLSMMGLYTLCYASLAASVEWDSKKIMAYSTLSQLGLMCYSVGSGLFMFAFFHLLIHALFKALLFIVVGYSLVEGFHLQDLRGSGGWGGKIFNSFLIMMMVFCLSGFIFFGGFYSKDLMMEGLVMNNLFLELLFWFSLMLTGFYSVRLSYYVIGGWGGSQEMWLPKKNYMLSVIFLFISSIVLGWVLNGVKMNLSFFKTYSKFIMLVFILGGLFLYSFFNMSVNIYFKNLFFLGWLKSGFVMKNFKSSGQLMLQSLDSGIISFFFSEISTNLNFNRSLNLMNKLHNLKVWSLGLSVSLIIGILFF